MVRRTPYPGLSCPDGHGALLEMVDGKLRCVHQSHDGRPQSHRLGEVPGTRATFTLDEAEAAAKRRMTS